MKYYFHPKAKKEFLDAIEYYESCSKGLGLEFTNEIYTTIQRIFTYVLFQVLHPPPARTALLCSETSLTPDFPA